MNIKERSCSHLRDVQETYWEHLFFALQFSFGMFFASIAVLIHALCPAFFQFTGTRTIQRLHKKLQERAVYRDNA